MPIGSHVMIRLKDDRPFAVGRGARLTIARVLLHQGRRLDLLGFGAADNHVHAVLPCSTGAAAEFARRVEISLQRRLRPEVGFSRVHVVSVLDQRHLRNTFRYVLRQSARHGLVSEPCREGTNLPDLLGLRVLGRYSRAAIARYLPRFGRADLLELLGTDLDDQTVDLRLLPEAAAAAVGRPSLHGRVPDLVEARRAAVQVAASAGPTRTAEILGISRSTVARLLSVEADPYLVSAIRGQLRLVRFENAVRLAVQPGARGSLPPRSR